MVEISHRGFRAALATLGRDVRGSALPIMGAGLFLVLGSVGMAIDIGRIYLVKAQMQAGVDAAALAGARSFEATAPGPESRDSQVEAYFKENFPDNYLASGTVVPTPDFRVERGINITEVEATTDLPMIFMKLFGKGPHRIAVSAIAELQPRPLEIMVVLDNTGSMQEKLPDGRSRMSVLKDAMHEFVDVLYQGSENRPELALGIITYTVTTNIGNILNEADVPIQPTDGYTNLSTYLGTKTGIGAEGLAWGGCVENDPTQRDISNSATTQESAAWDVGRLLPHEHDASAGVRPYLYPPSTETVGAAKTAANPDKKNAAYSVPAIGQIKANYFPSHKQDYTSDGRRNNLYRLTTDATIAQNLANSATFRQHFYNFYIALNGDRTDSDLDDVIVREADEGYYPPGSADAWKVLYSRIPFIADNTAWASANANYGFPLPNPGYTKTTKMPTPNWQCPNPGVGVEYGRSKSFYEDYIDNHNHPLMPASGTLHHIGFVWGYRLLARDDIFERTNPIPDQKPLRAIVFMTDGQTSAGSHTTWYGSYGRLAEKRITNSTSSGTFANQVMYRFAKVCHNIKQEGALTDNPINIYIVSLLDPDNTTENIFTACAGENYLETTTTSQIMNAFRDIAVDLVELHLTK